jgi:hypothetical protein
MLSPRWRIMLFNYGVGLQQEFSSGSLIRIRFDGSRYQKKARIQPSDAVISDGPTICRLVNRRIGRQSLQI